MSEYDGFGYDDQGNALAAGEQSDDKAPKWYRDRMDKVSEQLNTLVEENNRLKATQRQATVAETLQAKGYAPQAASLFPGEPAGLDDWLTANAAALAKLPAAPGEEQDQGGAPQGPPPTVVSPESQAAMAAMAAAGGSGPGAPQGSDNEMAAKLAACSTEQEFDAVMKAAGSRYFG